MSVTVVTANIDRNILHRAGFLIYLVFITILAGCQQTNKSSAYQLECRENNFPKDLPELPFEKWTLGGLDLPPHSAIKCVQVMSDITTQTSDRNIVIIDFESPIDMANAGKFFVESMSKNFSLDSNNGREITGHNVQYFFDLKLTRKGSFTAGHLLMHYPQT